MFVYVFFLLIGFVICFDLPPTWLNPSDLHHSRKVGNIPTSTVRAVDDNLVKEPVKDSKFTIKNETCSCPTQQQSPSDSYLKRMVNLLLFESHMKNYRLPEGNIRLVPLTLHFTAKNLEILHGFASTENLESLSWSDFDQAFSSLFKKPEDTEEHKNKYKKEGSFELKDYTYFIFIFIVGSLLISGLWLLLTSGSLRKSLCGLVFLNFAIALFWNLIRAYNMEKAKQVQRTRIIQSSSFWPEFITNPFRRKFGTGTSDESLLPENDPMFNINYGEIVIETLCTVLNVLPAFGEKVGEMSAKYYGAQNCFIRWVVQPLQSFLIPLVLVIAFLLLAIVQKGFSIKLPFFSIGIGGNKSTVTEISRNNSQSPQIPHLPGGHLSVHDSDVAQYRSSPAMRQILNQLQMSEARIRDKPQRLPSITCTRKGRIIKRRHTSTVLASNLLNNLDQ